MEKPLTYNSYVSSWVLKLDWVLRILILVSGLYNIFWGQLAFGILITVAWAIVVIPAFFTRNFIHHIPIEIEILLLLMIIFQYILGQLHQFYTRFIAYDNIIHFMFPMFIGIIGFLIFYTLYAKGKLQLSKNYVILLVVLIAVGIGGLWEIFEYLADIFLQVVLHHSAYFQGTAQQSAIDDTMTDLMYDTVGGVIGALLTLWFISKAGQKNSRRLEAFIDEFATRGR